jgi:hypothetical protein
MIWTQDYTTLAGVLGMDLVKGVSPHNPIRGSARIKVHGPEPLSVASKMTVEGSGAYPYTLGVVLHIMGDLYAVVLVSREWDTQASQYMRMWLVNRQRMAKPPAELFPAAGNWDAEVFYAGFVDAIVGGYRRAASATAEWVVVPDARAEVVALIEARKAAGVSRISARFRTVGPRGV